MTNPTIAQIGNTPILPLERMSHGLHTTLLGKAEMFNPGGSIKDRLAKSLIEAAEREGNLIPGGTAIEVTSGNTGIAIAWICAIKGYHAIIVMSDKNSKEKQDMIKAFGAEVVITPHTVAPDDPASNYKVAERLARDIAGSVYLDQYNNPANIDCHYRTTGPEIWEQTDGKVDCVIAGAGTGGTISGIGRFLKDKNPNIEIIAVDPKGSVFGPFFNTGQMAIPGHYEIEGIGSDKLVAAMEFSVIDQFITADDREAFLVTRELAKTEGLFCGGSSGGAIAVARQVLKNRKDIKTPVVILPDSGDRYYSKVFNDNWMAQMGYFDRA